MRAPLNTFSRKFPLRALLILGIVAGCKESSGPPDVAPMLTVHSGNGQAANVGTPVPQPLAVRVVDASNEPVAGITVTFAVTTGGGTITGASATTGADGIATAGSWTLGNVLGSHTVEASAPGLSKVTFSATGLCATGGSLALDATLTGVLATNDCVYAGGQLTDRFTFTSTVQRAVRFSQTSQLVDTYLELYDVAGNILAANDDSASIPNEPGARTVSMMKVLLAPGTYEVSPSSYYADETGGYSVSAVSVPESENTCELIFAMPGITTVGELATGDCATTATTPFLAETIAVFMQATRTYTVTITSSAFDPFLELYATTGAQPVVADDRSTGTTARVTFTPTTSTFFVIYASTAVAGVSGAFTLTIQ